LFNLLIVAKGGERERDFRKQKLPETKAFPSKIPRERERENFTAIT